jgi:hypothetical protein
MRSSSPAHGNLRHHSCKLAVGTRTRHCCRSAARCRCRRSGRPAVLRGTQHQTPLSCGQRRDYQQDCFEFCTLHKRGKPRGTRSGWQGGVPGGREAEGDGVLVCHAGEEGAGAVVVGVTVGARARRLEDGGVRRGVARVRRSVRAAAAVPALPERLARAPARDGAAAAVHLQLLRARCAATRATVISSREVAGGNALGRPRDRNDRQMVAVDKAHVVEVLVVGALPQRDLEQRGRGCRAGAGAPHRPASVARLAHSLAVSVEHAPRPRPYPPRPPHRRRQLDRLPGLKPEPRRGLLRRAGACECPRPDRVGAVVRYGERHAWPLTLAAMIQLRAQAEITCKLVTLTPPC